MNFRQVRKKIKTVSNVRKITNAMQMVSAVKMRKAQKTALEGREYRLMLDRIIQKVVTKTSDVSELNIPWLMPQVGSKDLYVLISSNKGLCGSFHTYLFKLIAETVENINCDFITVGQKGSEFVSRLGYSVISDFSHQTPFSDNVSSIFSVVEEKYASGNYKNVFVLYNRFVSSFQNQPTKEVLLPVADISVLDLEKEETQEIVAQSEYLIEPSVDVLLRPLVEDFLKEKIRSAISDSEASEHSARMMAMKNATDNADEVTFSLTLLRNKLRQTQITYELLDIIGAKTSAEA